MFADGIMVGSNQVVTFNHLQVLPSPFRDDQKDVFIFVYGIGSYDHVYSSKDWIIDILDMN